MSEFSGNDYQHLLRVPPRRVLFGSSQLSLTPWWIVNILPNSCSLFDNLLILPYNAADASCPKRSEPVRGRAHRRPVAKRWVSAHPRFRTIRRRTHCTHPSRSASELDPATGCRHQLPAPNPEPKRELAGTCWRRRGRVWPFGVGALCAPSLWSRRSGDRPSDPLANARPGAGIGLVVEMEIPDF